MGTSVSPGFEGHKRALMRQISERDELLETQRMDMLNASADEVRRAQEAGAYTRSRFSST
jgi:hypothetical protein